MVEQPSGRGDDDRRPRAELADLLSHRRAADQHRGLQVQLCQNLFNLQGEFTRWGEHESDLALAKVLCDRQPECECFAGARLGDTDEVPAL